MQKINKPISKIDVVIPFYNENSNLKIFIPSLIKALKSIKKYKFRVIFVDDGSTDNGGLVVKKFLKKKNKNIYFFFLNNKTNEGQTGSYKKYFKKFKSSFFLRIDSDNQDNPKDIINLLNKFDGSQDMILTHRMRRKHDSFLIIQGKLYSFLSSLITGIKIKTFTSSLVLYRTKFFSYKKLKFNDHRYLPLLACLNGAKNIKVIPVKHNKRKYGASKYKVSNKILLGPFEFLFFLLRYYFGFLNGK